MNTGHKVADRGPASQKDRLAGMTDCLTVVWEHGTTDREYM